VAEHAHDWSPHAREWRRVGDELATRLHDWRRFDDSRAITKTERRLARLRVASLGKFRRRKSDPPAIRRRPRATFGGANSDCPFGGGRERELKAMDRLLSPSTSARGPPRFGLTQTAEAPNAPSWRPTRRET
jgi:hypothetical protein